MILQLSSQLVIKNLKLWDLILQVFWCSQLLQSEFVHTLSSSSHSISPFLFFFFFLTVQVLDSTRTLSKFRSMSHLTKWKASLALQTVIALVGNHTVLAFTFNWAILSSSLKRLVSATHETERKNRRIMFLGRFWCYCCSFRIEHTMKFLR